MIFDFLGGVSSFFDFLWNSFLLLGPMLMLGLFLSGLIHVFISRKAILKWLQDDSLKSVSTSAAIGVPIPLCSCSVVPVVAEMRRKGASRSSCMSFLITAPETGADSILVTNAFFGWIAAVVRPVISFITAVVAGIFCIGLIRDDRNEAQSNEHEHTHEHEDHEHDHGHQSLIPESDDCYIRPSQFKDMAINRLKSTVVAIGNLRFVSWIKPDFYRDATLASKEMAVGAPPQEDISDGVDDKCTPPSDITFKKLVKHIFKYGFVEIADDILFALLVGLVLGGLLYLAIPSDLMANEYARWLAYPIMVIFAVPLYICASASTPIAAALVAKGFSPGAALIFLMTGPATNTGTIAIIISQFGSTFASIYVGIVVAVTVILGIAIDLLLLATGFSIAVNLEASDTPAIQFIQWAGAIGLAALIIWRFRAGALKSGYEDLLLNVRPVFSSLRRMLSRMLHNRKVAGVLAASSILVIYLASGFSVIPPGTQQFPV